MTMHSYIRKATVVLASSCAVLAGLTLTNVPTAAAAPAAPQLEAASVSDVSSTSATLSATLNPEGAATTYAFEVAPAGGAFTPVAEPQGKGSVAEGAVGVALSVHVQQGLLAAGAYEFRVSASNSAGSLVGEPVSFTTQSPGAFALPDGRQWEMVSPPNKHGALIEPISNGQVSTDKQSSIKVSANGDEFAYVADAPTQTDVSGYANATQVLSVRGPEGWVSHDISLPHESATGASFRSGSEYRDFSEDLSLAIVQPFGAFIPASSAQALSPAQATEQTAFLRTDYLNGNVTESCPGTGGEGAGTSCYRPLVTAAPGYANVTTGAVFGGQVGSECATYICGPEFVGATPDLSHVVVESKVPLTNTTPAAAQGGLYEWSGGNLRLVSVLPDDEPSQEENSLGLMSRVVRNAISEDGTRVIWTGGRLNSGNQHLYLWDMATEKSVQLDTVQSGASGGNSKPMFAGASADGSRIFFYDSQMLTADSGGATVEESSGDLYECEMLETGGKLTCELRDLTPVNASSETAHVRGTLLGVSGSGCDIGPAEDCYVYFMGGSRLAVGAVSGSCEGGLNTEVESGCNLYVRHDGVTKLVAVLANKNDFPDWTSSGFPYAGLEELSARVSPNGHWLAFMSDQQLVPGESTRDALTGKPDQQVYLYDAQTAKLVCASCNPTGGLSTGAEDTLESGFIDTLVGQDGFWPGQELAATIPGFSPYAEARALYQSRYLSDSGRLFFNSGDALVPQDVDGTWDVYEYEPPSVGDCGPDAPTFSGRKGGCVGLISNGTSDEQSVFLDASEDGSDVFFLTKSKLVTADGDNALDVYDAHECSSATPCFASPSATPPPCDTEASCKVAPTPQPASFGAPASATFSGAGNLPPASTGSASKPRALTRAQKLAAALSTCRKKPKRKRATCEKQARRAYGPVAKPHKSTRAKSHKRSR
jgi:hypothetical protein